MTVDLPDDSSTVALGQALARALRQVLEHTGRGEPQPLIVGLRGELGAGKTTLARGLLRGLGHRGRVPSPTYTLVEPYTLGAITVYHIDLYRVRQIEELRYLGLEDCLGPGAVWLVEWPERGGAAMTGCDLDVHLKASRSGRSADIEAWTPRGRALTAAARLTAAEAS